MLLHVLAQSLSLFESLHPSSPLTLSPAARRPLPVACPPPSPSLHRHHYVLHADDGVLDVAAGHDALDGPHAVVSLPPCEHRRILQWYIQCVYAVCVCVCVCVCVVEGKGRRGLFGHRVLHTRSLFVWFYSHSIPSDCTTAYGCMYRVCCTCMRMCVWRALATTTQANTTHSG